MNTGIEILLQRMKDCPEDFYHQPNKGMSRWHRLVDHAIADEITTLEEHEALKEGMKEVRRQSFTELVLKELAGEGEASDEGKWADSIMQAKGISLAGQTQLSSTGQSQFSNTYGTVKIPSGTITLGNTELSEAGLNQMLATHKAMREQLKQKRWWNKTIPELLGKK
jgi:hypothetical protein